MKKLLLFAVSIAFVGMVQAQDCTPQINHGVVMLGLNPNPPAGSVAGIPYDEVNTLVIPRQVNNTITPAPGDSIALCAIEVLGITGMPPGYSYDVWAFHNGSPTSNYDVIAQSVDTIHIMPVVSFTRVCIRLKNPTPPASSNMGDGLPTRDTAVIQVVVGAYAMIPSCNTLGPSAQDTFEVHLAIKDAVYAGIEDQDNSIFVVGNNFPNPAADITYLNFYTPQTGDISINVYDAVGRNVHAYKGTSYEGKNIYGISTTDLTDGVYMYSITYGGKTVSKKMVVNK
jgi:hypothetical protein